MVTYSCMHGSAVEYSKALTKDYRVYHFALLEIRLKIAVVADRGVPDVRHSSGESFRDSMSSKDQMHTSTVG